MTSVYDRRSGELALQEQYGEAGLRMMYGHPVMIPLVNAVFTRPWFSRLLAWPSTWRHSAKRIPGFAEQYGVDLEDAQPGPYRSFADFFTRQFRPGARPADADPARLIAPADSKLLAYPITSDMTVQVKGFTYTLDDLLGRHVDWDTEHGDGSRRSAGASWCLVFRLTVDDVHRYCFMDDCEVVDTWSVPGRLHTVGPWSARRFPVLADNQRVVTVLETAGFGKMIVIEVGALLVGRIINRNVRRAQRGEEKGHFAYGGSTIVVLTSALPDPDIRTWSQQGVETRVRQGEAIATKYGDSHDS